MILLRAAHHVVVQGFNIAGSNAAGQPPTGPRAGIMLDGEFRNTGKQVHHILFWSAIFRTITVNGAFTLATPTLS
jgi:hypothetical protein